TTKRRRGEAGFPAHVSECVTKVAEEILKMAARVRLSNRFRERGGVSQVSLRCKACLLGAESARLQFLLLCVEMELQFLSDLVVAVWFVVHAGTQPSFCRYSTI